MRQSTSLPTNEPEPDLIVLTRIVEYWVIDVAARRLVVHLETTHRDPREGLYRSVTASGEDETVSPLASLHSEFRVADAFSA